MSERISYIEYDSNNSGGGWWLKDHDWRALEAAGWEVQWVAKDKYQKSYADKNGRWLNALATRAIRRGLTMRQAVEEFERVTGQNAADEGCNCCGQPHNFRGYDENDKIVHWGPQISKSTSLSWKDEA